MGNLILGIDIGGTSIKIGLITEDGSIKYKWEIATNVEENGKNIPKDIWKSVNAQLDAKGIAKDSLLGIGMGAPGFIDIDHGVVYQAVNIGWKNLNLVEIFNQWTDLPVYVANDADVAALGENWQGSGDQSDNLMAITVGTGVGGGFITNGTIINGENGTGGEIGHMVVDPQGHLCNCGLHGCLETIASATGIIRQAKSVIEENPNHQLAQYYEKHGKMNAKVVFDFAKEGDQLSLDIVDHTSMTLGLAIANVSAVLNPKKILIGGGVSKAGDFFIRKIDKAFRKYALPRVSEICEIKAARLGNDAGMIGAAYLVKENL